MRAVAATAWVELKRFLRDRSTIFFVFIFPLLFVLLIGVQFGGAAGAGSITISGPDSELTRALTQELQNRDLRVRHLDEDAARTQVVRGRTDAALFIDDDAAQRFANGTPATVQILSGSAIQSATATQIVQSGLETVHLPAAAEQELIGAGVAADDAAAALDRAGQEVVPATVQVRSVSALAQEFAGVGQFDIGASAQLLLFTFLSSMAGADALIRARREGVIARALSTPASSTRIFLGLAAGRWVIAGVQGAYIMIASRLLFGVNWGDWGLSLLVLAFFAAVAAGATMVLGAVIDHASAASGIGVGLSLALAGLGGAMAPLEIFSDTMQQVAKITPHSWAYRALAEIQRRDGGLPDILPELGVLLGFALVLLALGSSVLRRSVTRAM